MGRDGTARARIRHRGEGAEGGGLSARLTLRLGFGPAGALGPGKVRLLELIEETGSIAAAGRAMQMSYRRAWLLVDSLNSCFKEPVVETRLGGTSGGGARLTRFGADLVQRYRRMELRAQSALARDLAALEAALAEDARAEPDPHSGRPED